MVAQKRSIFALLRQLERDRLCRLDPGLSLAIEELLRAGSHRTHEELAAAIASLCARDPDKWRIINGRALDYFAELAGDANPVQRIMRSEGESREPEPRRSLLPTALLAVGALVLIIGITLFFEPSSVDEGDGSTSSMAVESTTGGEAETTARSTTVTPPPTTADTVQDTGVSSTTEDLGEPPATTGAGPEPEPAPTTEPELQPEPELQLEPNIAPRVIFVLTLVLSFGLVVLGVRLLFASALKRLHATFERKRLLEESEGVRVRYNVPRGLPFAAWVVDAAADVLARRRAPGLDASLDVPATIEATVRAGGRVVPRMEPGIAPRTLLVLVAIEGGDHPMLAPVESILDRWREAGLSFDRYDFHDQLTNLRDPVERASLKLDGLSRRAEGRPLLIFARSTRLASKAGAQGWLRRLRAWPIRALIDLDPRASEELDDLERRFREAIDGTDLRRFAFTARGLEAMARFVGSDGRITLSVDDEPLPPLASIEPELRCWAYCLACVPDPSWPQLEVFRRAFADSYFAGKLDDFRVIERLLEWLRADLCARGYKRAITTGSGYGIDLGEEQIRRYLAELWESDVDHALEDACHRILLQQLRSARPKARLDRLHNRAKIYEHELLLVARDPAAAAAALRRFEEFKGTAAEGFARKLLERHAARVAMVESAPRGLTGLPELIEALRSRPLALTEALLDRDGWRATRRALAAGVAAAAGNALVLNGVLGDRMVWFVVGGVLEVGALGGLVVRFLRLKHENLEPPPLPPPLPPPPPAQPRPLGGVHDSPTGRALGVRHTALDDTPTPMSFVELTGGEFTMGSRDGDADERPRHRVRVPRFLIAEAPVTQVQYEAVTGDDPSLAKGADVPVNNVSWEDAARFCNALSKREGLRPCYRQEDGQWRWDHAADGYRLPTEEEWEYACRAGSTGAYCFGDDVDVLGEYAWFERVDAQPVKKKQPNRWGLFDMHGNVWEWCWDWFDADWYAVKESPQDVSFGPHRGEVRVLRGGGFFNSARVLRSADRFRYRPSLRRGFFGCRCVRSWPSSVDR